jgi:hypothetical protein
MKPSFFLFNNSKSELNNKIWKLFARIPITNSSLNNYIFYDACDSLDDSDNCQLPLTQQQPLSQKVLTWLLASCYKRKHSPTVEFHKINANYRHFNDRVTFISRRGSCHVLYCPFAYVMLKTDTKLQYLKTLVLNLAFHCVHLQLAQIKFQFSGY